MFSDVMTDPSEVIDSPATYAKSRVKKKTDKIDNHDVSITITRNTFTCQLKLFELS